MLASLIAHYSFPDTLSPHRVLTGHNNIHAMDRDYENVIAKKSNSLYCMPMFKN